MDFKMALSEKYKISSHTSGGQIHQKVRVLEIIEGIPATSLCIPKVGRIDTFV